MIYELFLSVLCREVRLLGAVFFLHTKCRVTPLAGV